MPPTSWVSLARAGAMMTANSTGVSRGMRSSRGVLALRTRRRRASVAKGTSTPLGRGRACASAEAVASGTVVAIADTDLLSRGQAIARQPQVDVVEGGPAGGHAVGVD